MAQWQPLHKKKCNILTAIHSFQSRDRRRTLDGKTLENPKNYSSRMSIFHKFQATNSQIVRKLHVLQMCKPYTAVAVIQSLKTVKFLVKLHFGNGVNISCGKSFSLSVADPGCCDHYSHHSRSVVTRWQHFEKVT